MLRSTVCDLTVKLCSSGIFVQCTTEHPAAISDFRAAMVSTLFTVSVSLSLFFFIYFRTLTKLCWQQKSCQSDESVGKIIKLLHLRTNTFIFKIFLALLAHCSYTHVAVHENGFFIKCPLSPSGVWGFFDFNFLSRNKSLILNLSISENPIMLFSTYLLYTIVT